MGHGCWHHLGDRAVYDLGLNAPRQIFRGTWYGLVRIGVAVCKRALRFGATVLPIPLRSISASIAPLDVHEYVFGCEFCRTRLAFEWVRSADGPEPKCG